MLWVHCAFGNVLFVILNFWQMEIKNRLEGFQPIVKVVKRANAQLLIYQLHFSTNVQTHDCNSCTNFVSIIAIHSQILHKSPILFLWFAQYCHRYLNRNTQFNSFHPCWQFVKWWGKQLSDCEFNILWRQGCTKGRVENSKTYQNQMFFHWFIWYRNWGWFLFFPKNFFWWVEMDLKKINFYKGKMAKISPKITKIEI